MELLVVKYQLANAGDVRNSTFIPGLEDPLEEGMATHSNYSCLENPMDKGAWRATVHRITESDKTEATGRTQHMITHLQET